MRLSKREKVLGVAAIICLACGWIVQGGYGLIHRQFEITDHEIFKLNEILHHDRSLLNKQARIDTDFRQVLKELGDQESDQSAVPQMLAVIHASAQTQHINIRELNPMPVERVGHLRTIKFKVSLSGSWASILDFVNDLQEPSHRFDVEDVILESAGPEDQTIRGQLVLIRWSVMQGE